MKVIAINGSPRKNGNTTILIKHVFEQLHKDDIETELVELAGSAIRGCTACNICQSRKDRRCVLTGDPVNECIEKMAAADGIILGSPTYFSDVTSELKALIDRSGRVGRANGMLFKRKVAAAVIAVRRGGAIHAFDTINHFFHLSQMIIPGALYWNFGIGREVGDVENDTEGKDTMTSIGQNMAWLIKKIQN
ncbi:MAG: flavodoxin family protein [Chitinivibrionales bacterium]|nr:flavodoxin family protein [Chitinivibrionales bacterium]